MLDLPRNYLTQMEPDEEDKLLFAEDLVSHFMDKLLWKNTPFSKMNVAPISGGYRDKVYNGFNETIRETVDILHFLLQERIRHRFFEVAVQNKINYISFQEFEKDIRQLYFSYASIDAIRFLKYCVFLAVLAGKFYKCGYKSTPDMAAHLIAKAFPDGLMSRVSWEVLNMAAKAYIRKNKFLTELPSTNDSKEDLDDSEFAVRQRSLDSDRGKCSCFQAPEEGGSFKKLFKNRDRVLRYHKIICLGRIMINPRMDISSTMKPTFLDQSMHLPDSLDKSQNSETISNFGHLPDLSRTYYDKTQELFGSQMGLETSWRPPETPEVISDSGREETSCEIAFIETYREKTNELFGREIKLQESEQLPMNPGSPFGKQALDTRHGHGQASNSRNSTLPYHDSFKEFFGIDVEKKDHSFSTLSVGAQHQQLSKWPTVNINHQSLMKALDDIRTQSVRSGFEDISVFQKPDAIFDEASEVFCIPPAVTAERIAQEVEQFFRSRNQSFQKENETPLTINVDSKDKNISTRQIPDIDYKLLSTEWNSNNKNIQNFKEKPLRIGVQSASNEGSRTCQETEPFPVLSTEWPEVTELSNKFLNISFNNVQNPEQKPVWFGGFRNLSVEGSRTCQETEPFPVLRTESPGDTEVSNAFLTAPLNEKNVQNLEEKLIRIGALPNISNEESRTFQENEPMPRTESPEDTELFDNLKAKSEVLIDMIDDDDESSEEDF